MATPFDGVSWDEGNCIILLKKKRQKTNWWEDEVCQQDEMRGQACRIHSWNHHHHNRIFHNAKRSQPRDSPHIITLTQTRFRSIFTLPPPATSKNNGLPPPQNKKINKTIKNPSSPLNLQTIPNPPINRLLPLKPHLQIRRPSPPPPRNSLRNNRLDILTHLSLRHLLPNNTRLPLLLFHIHCSLLRLHIHIRMHKLHLRRRRKTVSDEGLSGLYCFAI